jgi:hypothetical protein
VIFKRLRLGSGLDHPKRWDMGADDKIGLMLQIAARIEGVRESTRLPVHAKARIRTNSNTVEGKVENLSMNGAYVTLDQPVKLNSSVVISIFDSPNTLRVVYDIKAKVVWVMGNGVGLQFA